MYIRDKLELIRYTLVTFSKNFDNYSPMTRRLMAMGVVAELYQVNMRLEELCLRLDSEISVEDAEIDFDDWLTNNSWINGQGIFNIMSYHAQDNKDTVINHMTDYLPLGEDGYLYTPEQAETFKTSLHQLCDDEKMTARDYTYTIGKALGNTITLLGEIKRKRTNIPSYLFEDYWYTFVVEFYENSPVPDIYEHWKEEHDDFDIELLKDKQMQEILVLLKSGFLSHSAIPTRREINQSIVKINKDSFDRTTIIPEDIDLECARLSKFVEWKENTILMLNYEKLGKYLYRHHREMTDKEKKSIAYFDIFLNLLHQDIAALEPKFKIYLKNNEGDELQTYYEGCVKILNTCNEHLQEGIGEDFFGCILDKVMYGEMKTELKSKLKGSSRMTTLCYMLAACKFSGKVFKFGVISEELAASLATIVNKPSKDSLKRYIDNGAANPRARIMIHTEEAIKDYVSKITDNSAG